jgi:hypothetical protein
MKFFAYASRPDENNEVLSMAPQIRWFGCVVLLAVSATLTVELGQSRAQNLNEGWNVLEGKFNASRGLALGFLKGGPVDANDKNHIEAIDLLAKTYTYGVYLRKLELQHDGIKNDFAAFERAVDGDILRAKNRQAMQTFAEIFRDKVRIHALEVIQYKDARPIHKLHNARVLAEVAKLGQEELADTLITVLKDPQQTDGVRYEMLKGLATLIPQLPSARQSKCAVALVEFLEQKKGPGKKATPEEIEGFRYFRREAVRALAKIRTPAIDDKVRPALVLARFAGNDASIQPPPRIDERIEAAIGLARMKAADDRQYQVDYAASQIGKCLGALAQSAEAERANKDTRIRPWRLLSALLKEALEDLKKNNDKNKYVVQIADRGTQLLNQVMRGDQITANEQTWWSSSQSDPTSKELFQGSADSVVKPSQPAETEPEK